MIWDGSYEIEPEIGEEVEIDGKTYVCRKGGGFSSIQLCNRCVLSNRRSLCASFKCVGTLRQDEMKVYLGKIERDGQEG